MKVIFSNDVDIKKVQKLAEDLKIDKLIRNIVNKGNIEGNESGKVVWESCEIIYEPINTERSVDNKIHALIKKIDGSILYESVFCKLDKDTENDMLELIARLSVKSVRTANVKDTVEKAFRDATASGIASYGRETKNFCMGPWVNRLSKYSESLSNNFFEMKMEPFKEINF